FILSARQQIDGGNGRIAPRDRVKSHRLGREDDGFRERRVHLDEGRIQFAACRREIAGVRERRIEDGGVDRHTRRPPTVPRTRVRRRREGRDDETRAHDGDRERGRYPPPGGIRGLHDRKIGAPLLGLPEPGANVVTSESRRNRHAERRPAVRASSLDALRASTCLLPGDLHGGLREHLVRSLLTILLTRNRDWIFSEQTSDAAVYMCMLNG